MGSQVTNHSAVVVPASAGSGKTYRIAHEYIYDVLRDRYDEAGQPYFDRTFYKRILAVTFTNKATEEMKSRILKEIHLLASGQKSDHLADLVAETKLDESTLRKRAQIVRSLILHDYSHFTVLTNDTFFQRILRAFVRELGIDINFSTELDTAPVLTKSVEILIEDITKNKELRKWLEELTADRISDGERWDIRAAITSLTGELFKESTKDIIAKSSDKESLRKSIKSFTAVVKAKQQELCLLGEKALSAIEQRGYSHDNFKLKFTKIFEKVATGTLDKITDAQIKHLTDSTEEWFNKGKATPDLLALADELQSIFVKVYQMHIDLRTLENTHRILSRNYRAFALLRDLQERVDKICRDENSMLLSETKHAIAGFISESEVPFIYEKVGNYFDKFMIDEFQDTSVKEWNNFLPLLRNAMAQSSDTSVLIVGDVKQSIYRWRGGDWRILGKQAVSDLGDCYSDPLKNNWRSLPNVVEFNNSLYEKIVESENESLNNRLGEAKSDGRISAECYAELVDTLKNSYANHDQTARRKHTNGGYISITAPLENAETELVGKSGMPLYVERIREVLERGFLPRDITILVRKNSEGMEIAEELLHYRDSFPEEFRFEITTEEALRLTASPAVKLIIAVMRLSINRNDTTSLVQYNHLHNNNAFGTKLNDDEMSFLDSIRTMSPEEAFDNITIRYAEDLEGQTAYVLALHEQIVRFSAGKVADIALFDKWWSEKGESLSVRVERSDRAIEILTIHKAKGLENKVVIIPNCSWSLEPLDSSGYVSNIVWSKPAPHKDLSGIDTFPVSFNRSVGDSLFAEGYFREMIYTYVDALNMLYVATTRAKEQLHIFLPNKRRGATIGTLLLDIYAEKMQQSNYSRQYEVGTFDNPEPEKRGEDICVNSSIIKSYNASPVSVKLRTSVSRYFADEEAELSPRSVGIRLHKAFEGATTREDIFAKLEDMVVNGELDRDEVATLKAQITDTLDNTIAGEWFSGNWEQLYRERNIIRPNGNSKRPDRVMINGKSAVVVDYKFGDENSAYARQIAAYVKELREMGYTSVKGYIWYITNGNIVEIE
ncbi:MAG: UvrD-helicase domain-containing protein [Alistipes sp.]|nr:UvrD-helicase domain-containing protein [Alistipes sp.]